jgi:hypothetical protein
VPNDQSKNGDKGLIASLYDAVDAAIEDIEDLASRVAAFVRLHVELLVITPAIAAAVGLVGYWTWTRGLAVVEVGPILIDLLIGILFVSVLGYLAWRFKSEYWSDLTPEDEDRLHIDASHGNKWAFWVIVKDRIEWLALFGVLYFALSDFAGAANPHARDLVIRWEVTSEQVYQRRYQSPVWPGGASGVTWCVGYDGGHQTAAVILADWIQHPQRMQLASTAGLTGTDAKAYLPEVRHIRTDWPMCVDVLDQRMLPRYTAMARQAYGRAFDLQTPRVQGALISEVLNRGPGMAGNRRIERRVIRDVCLPARDAQCVAVQLEASCRVWANDPVNGSGLCNRRRAEAAVARG